MTWCSWTESLRPAVMANERGRHRRNNPPGVGPAAIQKGHRCAARSVTDRGARRVGPFEGFSFDSGRTGRISTSVAAVGRFMSGTRGSKGEQMHYGDLSAAKNSALGGTVLQQAS